MKLSKPHSGTGVPPDQWDRDSGAGAREPAPPRAAALQGAPSNDAASAPPPPIHGTGARRKKRGLSRGVDF